MWKGREVWLQVLTVSVKWERIGRRRTNFSYFRCPVLPLGLWTLLGWNMKASKKVQRPLRGFVVAPSGNIFSWFSQEGRGLCCCVTGDLNKISYIHLNWKYTCCQMKSENLGCRLNQRWEKGKICGRFEWKIRLQLSQGYWYDTGILTFLSIVTVIIRKSNATKLKCSIRKEYPLWRAAYCCNTKETKDR